LTIAPDNAIFLSTAWVRFFKDYNGSHALLEFSLKFEITAPGMRAVFICPAQSLRVYASRQ
jgi:hypothetical protein